MAKQRDDDLFKDTTMTFGEHLDELRVCLFRAVTGLALASILGLLFGNHIVKALTSPMESALKVYYKSKAETDYTAWATEQLNAGRPVPYSLAEIKKIAEGDPENGIPELIYDVRYVHLGSVNPAKGQRRPADLAPPAESTTSEPSTPEPAKTSSDDPKTDGETQADGDADSASTGFARENLAPMLLWQPVENDDRVAMKGLHATEAFMIWVKAGLIFGAVLSSPWVFFQIWTFVASGLYPHERHYVYVFLPFSLGLFLFGAALAYLFVFQPVLDFLLQFNRDLGIDPDPRISEWLGFVLLLPIGFGISFQLPLVMLFLERLGIFNVQAYMQHWRIAILVIFVLSALLTPADPYSMLLMAIPLTFLYFGGVLMCRWFPRGASKPA